MNAEQSPPDPNARARADLARLRAAIVNGTHWVFLTDDARAARALGTAAPGSALFVEVVMHLTDRGDVFPVTVLAVSKTVWPPSAAVRVVAAASGERAPRPDSGRVRGGADYFSISFNPERLVIVWEQIRRGALTAGSEAGGG